MNRPITRLAALAVMAMAFGASHLVSPALGAYGLEKFTVTYENEDGSPATQAGSHPFQMKTGAFFNLKNSNHPEGEVKDFLAEQIAGLVADPGAVPQCSTVDFLTPEELGRSSLCPDSTAVGVTTLETSLTYGFSPLFNLQPPPGVALKLGFIAINTPVTIEVGLKNSPSYNGSAYLFNLPQSLAVLNSTITLWGNPADSAHDPYRGYCVQSNNQKGTLQNPPLEFPDKLPSFGNCTTNAPSVAFLTMPRACQGPLPTTYATDSWQEPGPKLPDGKPDLPAPGWITGEAPEPVETTGCAKLPFSPSITAQPTTKAASSPTGLDFSLDVHDEGLTSVKEGAVAGSDVRKAVVTLPEGFSTNPSLAEGLNVCTEADLQRETVKSVPGAGCPNASKVGTAEVETPLLEETVNGSLYVAKPYDNPEHSLIALYLILKNEKLGILVKQPLKVETDPSTGQITTVGEDLPQLPFSHFRLHFREGTRSPLASPSGCGTYSADATLYPWAGGAPARSSSAFQIITGPDAGACPSGGLPPFKPGLIAGTLNNAAGAFSPFNVRLVRSDSEQEITHFSIKLPPGIAGKLAGVAFCSGAQIAKAIARTGPHGGQEEIDDPSCPADSQVGRTLAGAGVGPSLTYASGKIYLAGPYKGSPISFVSITSGVVGPFDIGTVVVRLAIRVNPETGEVFLDSTGSDPIPHIIKGIPVHLRDIRAYTDRPEFTFNPTSCKRTSAASTLLGSGLDFASEADDRPVTVSTPFQAADCAALPFKPKLSLKLIGGTRRGAHPKLKAFLKMTGFGEAGVAGAQITLPKSEFIENAHFKTICTRVQFKEAGGNGEACPPGSIYGWARAKSPILSDPLEGPIFLRSSEHQLPDVVASLKGQEINVHLVGHVDSVKGRLRNTFETVPDAPVEWASFVFRGASKGLFVNSTNLCRGTHRAEVSFTGHNGKRFDYKPAMGAKCGRKAKKSNR